MAENRKAAILNRVVEEGYTDSYGALLYLTAIMSADPKSLRPRTDVELASWGGHFGGLRASLLCLVMHEKELEPDAAASVVEAHISGAIEDLSRSTGTETGG